MAERLLEQALATAGRESLEAADAMQLMAEARRRGTQTHEPRTLVLAKGALGIKERLLGSDHVDVAECLHQLGMLLLKRGERDEGRECLRRAWSIREERLGPDDPALARSLMVYGGLLLTDTSAEALELLDRAEVIQAACLDPSDPEIAQRMLYRAYVHHQRGELEIAGRLNRDALAILERTLRPDHPKLAIAHRSLGLLAHATCDYAEARAHYEQALTALELNYGQRDRRVGEVLHWLAQVDAALGNNRVAFQRYQRALEILREVHGDQHSSVAECSLDLGYLMREASDLVAAQEHYERALRFVDGGRATQEFSVQCWLHYGAFLHLSGDLAGAEEWYQKVRSTLLEYAGEQTPFLSWALYDLGFVAYQRGDFLQAHDLIRQAVEGLDRSPEAHMAPLYAHALLGLALAQHATENQAAALEHALLAEQVARRHLEENSTGLERQLAISYSSSRTNGLDLALSILLNAGSSTTLSHRAVAREIIRSRGLVFEEMVLRQRAMTTTSSPALSARAQVLRESIAELSNLLVRGAAGASPETYQQQIVTATRKKERAESDFARARGDGVPAGERAEADPERILAALPEGSALIAYSRFQRDPMAGGKPGHGWAADSPFRDAYAALILSKAADEPIVLALGSAKEIDDLISGWRGFTADGEGPLESMRRAGAALRRRIWDPVAQHLEGVKSVFVVPDQALHLVNLASLPTERDRYLLETGPLIHYLSTERDLLERHPRTGRGTGLLIMGGVAFDGSVEGSRTAEAGGKRRGPTLWSTKSEQERIPELARQFQDLEFGTLSCSTTEARDIASLWNASLSESDQEGEALLMLGSEASEGCLKRLAPGRRVLHLATHGFFLNGERGASEGRWRRGDPVPVESEASRPRSRPRMRLPAPDSFPLLCTGLALSGANQRSSALPGAEDGILTAEEIAMLDLCSVELAVLSACDTGLGPVQAGEGVFDLRRAFELAGVEKVIMSLWKVEDPIAERWMKLFYGFWREERATIPDAARSASLALLTERRRRGQSTHPHFWATFVALGN